jgi:hypothetical protein
MEGDMNKQELLDEAVADIKGGWPEGVCKYIKRVERGRRWLEFKVEPHAVSQEEFQQRARELGYGAEAVKPESWYCYETQKALRLPPVGIDVEYQEKSSKWTKCKIVFLSDYVVVINGLSAGEDVQIAFNYGDWPEFRPLDFNRKAEAERKRVVSSALAAANDEHKLEDILTSLYNAGFLRMPEDK